MLWNEDAEILFVTPGPIRVGYFRNSHLCKED